ncbi:MAG: hypothetical protein Q8Q87_00735 [Candidatus Omnitrophota bacterium]|nr:hypothetical protein [Candidatus Omnitrophota bacterium]
MKKIVLILSVSIFLSGCATPGDIWKGFLGISTGELETGRKDAALKVFDYDYDTCYKKIEKIINAMPKVSVYAKDKHMVAFYYIDMNTTPVGVFFKEIDPTRTQVEISSPSSNAKESVAKNIFSGGSESESTP